MRVSLRDKILREMIGNLLIHREFSSARYARFIIERDRMYTENANRAFRYGRITPKNLEPEPKNPIIANFFHQIRLADELGSGVRNLYHYVKIYSNAEPVFDEDDVFRLTVPLDDAYSADRAFAGELSQTGTAQKTTQKSNEELDPNRQAVGLAVGLGVGLGSLVLNEVTANPQIKMSEIALKYHVSKRTVERIFGKLSQDGRIVRVGGKRFGHWEVIG